MTHQLEAGIPHPLLEFPTIEVLYLTPTWILSIRQFLYNHNLTISVTDSLPNPLWGPYNNHKMNAEACPDTVWNSNAI
jgi:hypothetical protein